MAILRSHHGIAKAGAPRAGAPRPQTTDNLPRLTFADIFATTGVIGMRLTERARELAGTPVVIRGYMVPPHEGVRGVMISRSPAVSCPLCDPGAHWPDDSVLAVLDTQFVADDPFAPVEVSGILDIGWSADPQTRSRTLVRLRDAALQRR
jgi:hypothetical protein